MGKINNVWYAEFYSPVNSDKLEDREEFYAYAAEAIRAMRAKDPQIPIILLGDLNGHIKDHYSTETNDNGELILRMMKNQSLTLMNMNSPTWHREG